MENTVYTVDYFIAKFEAIRDNLWTTDVFEDGDKRCAQGHCGINTSNCSDVWAKRSGLIEAESLITIMELHFGNDAVARINNGWDKAYIQPTPKQRILAALYDIKAKQQPEVKERIVYVTVDKEVRELQKTELIEN